MSHCTVMSHWLVTRVTLNVCGREFVVMSQSFLEPLYSHESIGCSEAVLVSQHVLSQSSFFSHFPVMSQWNCELLFCQSYNIGHLLTRWLSSYCVGHCLIRWVSRNESLFCHESILQLNTWFLRHFCWVNVFCCCESLFCRALSMLSHYHLMSHCFVIS